MVLTLPPSLPFCRSWLNHLTGEDFSDHCPQQGSASQGWGHPVVLSGWVKDTPPYPQPPWAYCPLTYPSVQDNCLSPPGTSIYHHNSSLSPPPQLEASVMLGSQCRPSLAIRSACLPTMPMCLVVTIHILVT